MERVRERESEMERERERERREREGEREWEMERERERERERGRERERERTRERQRETEVMSRRGPEEVGDIEAGHRSMQRDYLTECIYQLVLEGQLHHEIVNLVFTITN